MFWKSNTPILFLSSPILEFSPTKLGLLREPIGIPFFTVRIRRVVKIKTRNFWDNPCLGTHGVHDFVMCLLFPPWYLVLFLS